MVAIDKQPAALTAEQRQHLIESVGLNCDISDARHAGMYSICGLALRLRDLFKWKSGLEPWQEEEPSVVLEWIGEQEALWESLAERDFVPLRLGGKSYDPLDADAVNKRLAPSGLFYGAGYAYGLKPTFFLAAVAARREQEGHPVVELGRELARDMLTLPALTQEGTIVVRWEAARMWLWDRMQYVNASGRPALKIALAAAGVGEAHPKRQLERLLIAQRDTFLFHELSESRGAVLSADEWRRLTADLRQTPAELFVRAVRDLLADTAPDGTLVRLVHARNAAAVALYTAFFDGLAREMFPELRGAFIAFVESGKWNRLERALPVGYERAAAYARRIADLHRCGGAGSEPMAIAREIEETLLQPLTDGRRKALEKGATEINMNP